jgi:signal peptidase II
MQAARGASLTSSDHGDDGPGLDSRRRTRVRWIAAGTALTAYAVDVVTQVLAVEHLSDRDPVPVVGDLLQLTLVRNPGAAFSTGTEFTVALSLLAIVAVGVVLWLTRRLHRSATWAVALGLLLAGIAGNLTDRILRQPGPLRGHVVDFFQLPSWPVFNVADICIDVGAGHILLQAFRSITNSGDRVPARPRRDAGEEAPS